MESVNTLLFLEAIRHMEALQRYENGAVQRMLALLNRSDRRLMAELADRMEGMDSGSFTMRRLESILTSIWSISSEGYAQIGSAMADEVRQFVPYEVSYQEQMLRTHLPAVVSVASVSAEQVYAAALSRPFQGILLRDVWKDLDATKLKNVRQAIAQGFVEGKTTAQIIREVRGTRASGYTDGLIQKNRRDVEAVVRTALGHTAGMAQDKVMEANADLISAVQWSSTLDLRTSPICRLRDRLLYTPDTHKPIGHKAPWLSGPGRSHWRAVTAGTPVLTESGWKNVESVSVGDLVLTHRGRWMPVLANRSKPCDSGVVRVIHTESGRKLRATDDHPVLASGQGWKFVGALEVGDKLFCDSKNVPEKIGRFGVVGSESEDGPPRICEPDVSIKRTIKLCSAAMGLESDHEIGIGEVEDACVEWVLRNHGDIETDESLQHHALALGHLLAKQNRQALSQLLAGLVRHDVAFHAFGGSFIEATGSVAGNDLIHDSRHASRVVSGHSLGVRGVDSASFLRHSESPVHFSASSLNPSGFEPHQQLLGSTPNGDSMFSCEAGKASIGEKKFSLDVAQGLSLLDVMLLDEASMVGLGFVHDSVIALEVQEFGGLVYDLEVQGDASYLASGVVVSNCRSSQVPVLKSYKELGIDLPEVEVSGRTRASLDGQVPKETSYAQWLKEQSAARQDDVLGPTRGRLLREGGLSMDDLYSNRGRYLTLDELRERDAEAFKRAGV